MAHLMTRLSYEHWLDRGLDILAQDGADALKIDRLCRRLGVTKGSFYHHFRNREVYVRALLEHWERLFTDEVIEQTNQYTSARERSIALNRITASLKQDRERAIRAWAQWDATAATHVGRVDSKRLAYLGELIAPLIPNPDAASLVAKLVYAHFLGAQQLRHQISQKEWQNMDTLLMRLFTDPTLTPAMEDLI